jgi:hypothetical protein
MRTPEPGGMGGGPCPRACTSTCVLPVDLEEGEAFQACTTITPMCHLVLLGRWEAWGLPPPAAVLHLVLPGRWRPRRHHLTTHVLPPATWTTWRGIKEAWDTTTHSTHVLPGSTWRIGGPCLGPPPPPPPHYPTCLPCLNHLEVRRPWGTPTPLQCLFATWTPPG